MVWPWFAIVIGSGGIALTALSLGWKRAALLVVSVGIYAVGWNHLHVFD